MVKNMDINSILEELDQLFMEERRGEIADFLTRNIEKAYNESKPEYALMLYNEQIGFYRETGEYEKSIKACECVLKLIDELKLQGTIPYATALLNIANAHRAAGLLDKSLDYYNQVIPIYKMHLQENDMYYASLYNNISLLHQEMGNFAEAKVQLKNALEIVINREDAQFEVAVTYANLSNTCIELADDDEAKEYACKAIEIFEKLGIEDAHYSAALSALGSLYYMDKEYEKACEIMKKSRDCVERYLGSDNIQYQRLTENIDIIEEKLQEEKDINDINKEDATGAAIEKTLSTTTEEYMMENAIGQNVISENDEPGEAEKVIEIVSESKEIQEDDSENDIKKNDIKKNNIKKNDIKKIEACDADIITDVDIAIYNAKQFMSRSALETRKAEEKEEIKEEVTEIIREEIKKEIKESGDLKENVTISDEVKDEEISDEKNPDEVKDEEISNEDTMSGMELCRRFYEEYGKPMISDNFKLYESRIAVGLVGKGSECFGFDDKQSQDHDFGPGFVMWVTRSVYNTIGKDLQAAYDRLPKSYMGVERINTFYGNDRVGVKIIEDFYKDILGTNLLEELQKNNNIDNLKTIEQWLQISEYSLVAATNGEIFRDDEGIFSRYRQRLNEYYPKAVWLRKIADACAKFSQNGQYNFLRMSSRGQTVAAELARAECVRQAMKLNYLLNRKYAPHDKWMFKGMPDNTEMNINGYDVKGLIEKISTLPISKENEEEILIAIESLAIIFANHLEKLSIIGKSNLYLDYNTKELIIKSDILLSIVIAQRPATDALALLIAKDEFAAFDKVKNEGGRASCQNNWPVFKIMRMSQYMTWPEEMLLQYLYEFKTNYAEGRNMVEEKYARMMISTAPLEYARFSKHLPKISEEKSTIIEEIVNLQVSHMVEFAEKYPKLAGNARYIHTYEDSEFDTSYETYLRGELSTYSDRLVEMYGRYVVNYAKEGKNIAQEIMSNTIHFYGYKSFEEANEKGI